MGWHTNSNIHHWLQTSEEELIFFLSLSFFFVCAICLFMKIAFIFGSLFSFFPCQQDGFLSLEIWATCTIDGLFIVSVCTVTAQWWPFLVLRLCMRHCRANLRETVAGEQPCSNVCRCIPNWEIAFLVIAISICALLYLPSHFRLSLISLPLPSSSLAHMRVLRHIRRDCCFLSPHCLAFPDFSLSLTHIDLALECGCSSHSGKRNEYILINAPTDTCRVRSDTNMHRCAQTPCH